MALLGQSLTYVSGWDGSNPSADRLTKHQTGWLLLSVLIVALCGIAYELIIAAVSSYLLGNSVAQFSITIGLFMFAMGIGSYLTKFIHDKLLMNMSMYTESLSVIFISK